MTAIAASLLRVGKRHSGFGMFWNWFGILQDITLTSMEYWWCHAWCWVSRLCTRALWISSHRKLSRILRATVFCVPVNTGPTGSVLACYRPNHEFGDHIVTALVYIFIFLILLYSCITVWCDLNIVLFLCIIQSARCVSIPRLDNNVIIIYD